MNEKTTNLMGLNLSVNSELIADAVRETIIASIAEGLGNKEAIIHEFVNSVMTDRVLVENGERPRGYSREKTCSRLEYVIRKAIMEIVREEMINMVEEQKPVLRELIRKEFAKKNVQNELVQMFMDSMKGVIENPYRAKINIGFDRVND